MITILMYQKNFTLGEIIYKLNDEKMKKKFVCKEILIFIAYVLACVIDTSIRYTHFFLINMKHPDPELFKEPNFS